MSSSFHIFQCFSEASQKYSLKFHIIMYPYNVCDLECLLYIWFLNHTILGVYIKPCDVGNNLSYLRILGAIIYIKIAWKCSFVSLSFKTAGAGLKYVNFSKRPGTLQPEGDACLQVTELTACPTPNRHFLHITHSCNKLWLIE